MAKKKPKKTKYEGILNEYIYPERLSGLVSPSEAKIRENEITVQRLSKLPALLKTYDIPENTPDMY